MPESPSQSYSSIPHIKKLFNKIQEYNVMYCHWKNNPEHVRDSFSGKSDVDVLFDVRQKNLVETVIQELGFKKFDVIQQRKYKDIEDFIALEFVSGKLIHLHTHYRLKMGPPYAKNYQLGLEDLIFEKRIYLENLGLYGTSPSMQLLLLYINESLKFRMRDKFKLYLGYKIKYSDKLVNELKWLRSNVDVTELKELASFVFKDYIYALRLIQLPFNKRQVLKFGELVKKEFSSKDVGFSLPETLLSWKNEYIVNFRKLGRYFSAPMINRRINPRGGFVVAFIGADGSGKSTVTKDLRGTFENKLDVFSIYFGRGDGKISFFRLVLRNLKSLFFKDKIKVEVKTKKAETKNVSRKGMNGGVLTIMYKIMIALLVAFEKNANIKRMIVARQKGMLVICDRFPQNQIMGYNDGPLLHKLLQSKNPIFKILAKWEAAVYQRAMNNPPDLLIKLVADATIVEKRKPGENLPERLELKIEGIKQLQLNKPCTMITIDASLPLKDVLFQVRKEIWNRL